MADMRQHQSGVCLGFMSPSSTPTDLTTVLFGLLLSAFQGDLLPGGLLQLGLKPVEPVHGLTVAAGQAGEPLH